MKTLLIALVGFFLSVTLTGAEEPTTQPATQMIADVVNGRVEIAGKTFVLGTHADALVDQLGKPDSDGGGDYERVISYAKSLGFWAVANKGQITGFVFFLRAGGTDTAKLNRPNVKTVEGIGANSTRAQIENAYGKPETANERGEVISLYYAKKTFHLDKDGLFQILMSDGRNYLHSIDQ